MPKGTIGGNIQDELGMNVSATIDFSTGVLSISEDGKIVLHKNKSNDYASGSVSLVTWPTNRLLSFVANPRYTLEIRASGKKTVLDNKFIDHSGTTILIGNL